MIRKGRLWLLAGLFAGGLLGGVSTSAQTEEAQFTDSTSGGEARLASWDDHLAHEQASPFSELQWRALGPKNCGGRIEGIDSPKGQPSIIYAGVGSGGVWKSVNGGLS